MSNSSALYCRLCAVQKNPSEIVDLTCDMKTRNEIIEKLAIFSVNTVDFTDEILPEVVCVECRDSVRNSYDFYNRIKRSQMVLKKLNVSFSFRKQIISDLVKKEYIFIGEVFVPSDNDKSDDVKSYLIKEEFDNENIEDAPSNDDKVISISENIQNASEVENSPNSNEKLESETSGPDDNRFECTMCGQDFPTWKELVRHTSTDNDHVPKKRKKATIKDRTCDICFKVFDIPARLKYHKQINHTNRTRDYVCDVCGKAYYSLDMLNSHKIIHNPETQDCKICKRTFISLLRLKKHLKTHDVARPFECNECHKKFRMKYQLSRHMIIHSDVFPFSCDICKKGFRFKNVLKNHLIIHSGAKPFECTVCGMDFTNWSNCNKHMIRRHKVSMAKRAKTAHGMMPLNQETLKPKEADLESMKWGEQMRKPRRKGKKKKNEESTSST